MARRMGEADRSGDEKGEAALVEGEVEMLETTMLAADVEAVGEAAVEAAMGAVEGAPCCRAETAR